MQGTCAYWAPECFTPSRGHGREVRTILVDNDISTPERHPPTPRQRICTHQTAHHTTIRVQTTTGTWTRPSELN